MNIQEEFAAAVRLQQAGQFAGAEARYRQILAVAPPQAEVHYNLGLVLRSQGRLAEAAAAYASALELRPDFPPAMNNLGATLESLGRLDEAEQMFRQAVDRSPDFAEAWNNLGGVLKDLGRIEEALGCFDRAIALQPENARLHSNRIFALQYHPTDDPAIRGQAAAVWGRRFAAPLAGSLPPPDNDPAPDRRLRVGYLSAYFREHCQALFTVPLLEHHAPGPFEIFCYSDVTAPDGVTARLQAGADTWRRTDKLDDAQVADLIRHDKIDVLVDLTLHLAHDRLQVFARQPAPVQVTWLGYPGTTGLDAIGYRLTDPWLDPPGPADTAYAEQSVRLPDSFWCYDPLTDQPPVNPLPALHSGRFTFGCLNNFCKVTEAALALWAQVLQAVPDSKLLLLAPPGRARDRVRARLGVAEDRVEFVGYQPRADYLQVYHRIDLGLDTFPYNGHTTSLDALWMGVPTVSRYGRSAVSRAGLSLLSNLGLAGLATASPAEFVDRAVQQARDPGGLADLRANLRARMTRSPLMDAGQFARNIEHAYRTMWRRWCETAAPH